MIRVTRKQEEAGRQGTIRKEASHHHHNHHQCVEKVGYDGTAPPRRLLPLPASALHGHTRPNADIQERIYQPYLCTVAH